MRGAEILFVVAILAVTPAVSISQDAVLVEQIVAQADSFIRAHDFSGARSVLTVFGTKGNTLRTWHDSLVARYETLLDRLEGVPAIPDSLLQRFVQNAALFGQKFTPANAGKRGAEEYAQFVNQQKKGLLPEAYASYLIAEHIRLLHGDLERRRLWENLRRANEQAAREDYAGLRASIRAFREEPEGTPLESIRKPLAARYKLLAEKLEEGETQERFEESREDIHGLVRVMVRAALNPMISIPVSDLTFIDPFSGEDVVLDDDVPGISTDQISIGADASYFLTPSFAFGVGYSRASRHVMESIRLNVGILEYECDLEFEAIMVSAMYTLDNRTGPRPFVMVEAGTVTSKLVPSGMNVRPLEQRSTVLGMRVGAEYLFSREFPLTLTGFLHLNALVPASKTLNHVNFEIGAGVGYIIAR